ncbi:uncharacterized protein PV09_00501 [Verruconis gallopava]|uniref:Uncharacterized protein n=1 Tax=Verruconis gallopava TaxID=253628 RepID=A0A0D1Z9J0_9PEZI|nr:uncharacterized protein PV09_00501 [Verruconis gallopava]KIW09637.1 hypothetical protein PV09_00501 [Verruconis gallopava]
MDATITPDITASIFTVLKKFGHPFILVGQAAHRWMGCGGCVDDAIDLLVRDDQFELIIAAFINSGYWGLFNPRFERASNITALSLSKVEDHEQLRPCEGLKDSRQPEDDEKLEVDIFLNYCCDADQTLQLTVETTQEWPFNYIRLWSEHTFHIQVNGATLIQIPALYHGRPLLAENNFHPTSNRADEWHFGPEKLSNLDTGHLTLGKADDTNLFIPTIPTYLDALVYHIIQYTNTKTSLAFISQWQIRNLTRYLYLELPDLRNQILFEVEGSTERFLENYFNNYKRKPFYVLSKEGELVLVERHSRSSYPELFPGHADTPRSVV